MQRIYAPAGGDSMKRHRGQDRRLLLRRASRAVELAQQAARAGEPCVMLGSDHPQPRMWWMHLAEQGIGCGGAARRRCRQGSGVIIRSHGESQAVYEQLERPGRPRFWTPPVPTSAASTRSWCTGGGAGTAAGDHGHAATTRRWWPSPAGAGILVVLSGAEDLEQWLQRCAGTEGSAPHLCLPDHLHQRNLGFMREKSKKRVYKRRNF